MRMRALWLLAGCTWVCGLTSSLNAQDANVDWNNASDDQVILQAIELTTAVPSNDVPAFANFYSAQHSPISAQPWPPLPANINDLNAWDLGSNIWVLDDLGFDYNALSAQTSQSMMAMDASPPLPGGGSGTNTSSPGGGFAASFDPGTNLWIAQEAVSGGNFTGILSNTVGGVQYQLLYANSLNPPVQWTSDGLVVGTDGTNWTPWDLPFNSTTNFFLNALSLQDDSGTGIPDYWWLEYFGEYTNADENALDPAGDGWTDGQKFAMGISPFAWVTPPAPSGFSVWYNSLNQTVTLNWQPSLGNVTGYTITRSADYGWDYAQWTTTSTTFVDTSPITNFPPEDGGTPVYILQANYTNGSSASESLSMFDPNTTVSGQMLAASGGEDLEITGPMPQGTIALQLIRSFGDGIFDYTATNFIIPLSDLSSNVLFLPQSDFAQLDDSYSANEDWYVQTVNSNGDVSAASQVGSEEWVSDVQTPPPFLDGREQLKQNLEFLLRAANVWPFFYESGNSDITYTYAYSGLYDQLPGIEPSSYPPYFDKFRPFEENYFFRNFVYSTTNIDESGFLTTGVQYPVDFIPVPTPPLTFTFQEETTNSIPAILDPANTPFITCWPETENQTIVGNAGDPDTPVSDLGLTGGGGSWSFLTPTNNWFGLPLTSVLFGWNSGGAYETSVLSLGQTNSNVGGGGLFWQYEAPQLHTVGYYFAQPWAEPLPGDPNFAVTNVTSTGLVAGFGQTNVFAGYAEETLLNAVPNPNAPPYAYLGQYFEPEGYQVDASGNVTANSAGSVSAYGEFVPTVVGPAALVTMPNYGENVQGTGIVQVVKLVLDVNHDGTMDLSATGPDNTTASSPYVFWANNNYDRWDNDFPFDTPIQDDQEVGFSACSASGDIPVPTPDCNYLDGNCNRAIPCTRDLEDFARLWIAGLTTNLLAALPPGCTISLNWGDTIYPNPNNPAIDLFAAADPDGGIGYQTNEDIATAQINNADYPYIGRIGPGSNLVLNAWLADNPAGTHFIWCGVSNGTGQLNLTIANSNGTVLAQTSTYIQIKDIKQMYERWTVGDNPSMQPATSAALETEGLPPGMPAFRYPLPQDTNTPYILWVHGYNMPTWVKDRFAETAYKRLYWQAYQGRFGCFNWPTAQNAVEFGSSEIQSWDSAQGLLNKLNDLNSEYSGNVYLLAHSLGNVAAGEALRLAGSNQVVNTYLALQGAVTAHAYDPNTAEYTLWNDSGTPDCYAYYWTNGAPCYFNSSQGAGTYVNFFNVNDWALNFWLTFENLKPHLNPFYEYMPPDMYWENTNNGIYHLFFPTNTYIIFDKIIQARSYALGAQPNVSGVFDGNQVDMPDVWPLDPDDYTAHIWHSIEYRSDNPSLSSFWNEVMIQLKLKQPQP